MEVVFAQKGGTLTLHQWLRFQRRANWRYE
jgi:hypothetical protein